MRQPCDWECVLVVQVRCSGYERSVQRLATLDVAGHVMLWDTVPGAGDLCVQRRFQLLDAYRDECTCLCLDGDMLLVGAREYVTMYDPATVAIAPLRPLAYVPASGSGSICR
jgi:hypothetical protein